MASSAPSQSYFWTNNRLISIAPNLLIDQPWEKIVATTTDHTEHPDFWHLAGLVCEAVLEVVCVSSLGYIAARQGLFPAKVQKDVANLNIYFFTPCLIFSKLAAQLTGDKLTELWIIPVILLVQTVVSWLAAEVGTRVLKINKVPQRNFVKAMAVFGNSNSLPLSLVISLSRTISGLHWDRIPGDNDKEVGARGILYLLVFSQLGQAARWSWGMNTLLRPLEEYSPEERGDFLNDAESFEPFKDDASTNSESSSGPSSTSGSRHTNESETHQVKTDEFVSTIDRAETPVHKQNSQSEPSWRGSRPEGSRHHISSAGFGRAENTVVDVPATLSELDGRITRLYSAIRRCTLRASAHTNEMATKYSSAAFRLLPPSLQKVLTKAWGFIVLVVSKIVSCLNVPLVAIILSVLVGSIPGLKAFFYTPGTFVNNTVTSAISQLAGVAVPLILFVLGGNLCKNTLPSEDMDNHEYRREKRNMLWCSIICRMLIPLLVMAPFLAIIARFTPISILDDPIFIIVCFLLTGAPSALQLAQICQVNDVYVPVISQLLVQSYVVWIFPSTLVLVMLALEVVKWAQNQK